MQLLPDELLMSEPESFHGWTEDAAIEKIEGGSSVAQMAEAVGISRSALWRWLNADEGRSARVTRARQLSAAAWDEKAERGIREASDPFELSRAKELAHHYRWRASKIAPKDYGDKTETTLTGPDGGPVQVSRKLSSEELMVIAAQALPT